MKIRETDRLIRNIAIVVRNGDESLKELEKYIRNKIDTASKVHNKSHLEMAREMWSMLKGRNAHGKLNEWIRKGYLDAMSYEEFDEHKKVLKRFQKNIRHLQELKKEIR